MHKRLSQIAIKMCNKAVNISPSAMYFVPECFKTQEMCVKADDTFPFVFGSFTYQHKTQKNVW